MSKSHTCINTAGGMIPPPCEACAEEPRCPHGWAVSGRWGTCPPCIIEKLTAVLDAARAGIGRGRPGIDWFNVQSDRWRLANAIDAYDAFMGKPVSSPTRE